MKAIMDAGQLVLVISVIASVITLGGIFYPEYLSPTTLFALDSPHAHQIGSSARNEAEAAPLPRMIDDLLKQDVKAGDAINPRNLIIDEDFIDPDNHCEFCQRYEYTPGATGKAGIAYGTDNGKSIDLSGARKVSFFVMGEEGGEKLKFKVGGTDSNTESVGGENTDGSDRSKRIQGEPSRALKSTDNGSASALAINDDLFAGKAFAKTTEEVSLSDDWKRYEIDLAGVDLTDTENPFAIEIMKKSSNAKQIFYVKGITFDAESATNPLATVDTNTTMLDGNQTALNQSRLASTDGNATTTERGAADTENSTERSDIVTPGNDNQTSVESALPDNATNRQQETDSENENNDTSSESDDNRDQVNATLDDNQRPTATVRPDAILAHPGDAIVLDATDSADPDGDDLSFSWNPQNDEIEITDNEDSPTPTATVSSEVEEDTELAVELVVSDGNLESEPFEVTIVVDYFESVEVPDDESYIDAEELQIQAEPSEVSEVQLDIDEVGTIGNWNPDSSCSEDMVNCLGDKSDDTFVSAEEESADIFLFDTSERFDTETEISINYVSAEIKARSTPDGNESTVPAVFVSFVIYDEGRQEYYLTPAMSISSDSFDSYSNRWSTNPIDDGNWNEALEKPFLVGYVYSGGDSGAEISEFTLTISYYESTPENEEASMDEGEESETQSDTDEDEPDSPEEQTEEELEQPSSTEPAQNGTNTSSTSGSSDEESPDESSGDDENNSTSTE